MQTSFVLFVLEVRTPEPEHGLVIPPDETADGTLEQIRYEDESPKSGSAVYILWRELGERRNVAVLR